MCCVVMVGLMVGLAAPCFAQKRPTCAVLTFEAGEGISAGQAKFLTDRFSILLAQAGKYDVIARSRMTEILKTAEFNRGGQCSASECAVEAGQLLQVRYMIFGAVGKFGNLYSLTTSLVDVETGRLIRTALSDHEGSLTEFGKSAPTVNIAKLIGKATKDGAHGVLRTTSVLTNRQAKRQLAEPEPGDLTAARALRPQRDFEISLRAALAFWPTGMVGFELRYRYVALELGLGVTTELWTDVGLKTYFNPLGEGWWVAAVVFVVPNRADIHVIPGAGYQWHIGHRWDFSCGLGLPLDVKLTGGWPVWDLSFGYSF